MRSSKSVVMKEQDCPLLVFLVSVSLFDLSCSDNLWYPVAREAVHHAL